MALQLRPDPTTKYRAFMKPAVATGGNRSQMASPQNGHKQAKTIAVRCDGMPRGAHRKEGVDGSKSVRGSILWSSQGFGSHRNTWKGAAPSRLVTSSVGTLAWASVAPMSRLGSF